MKMNPCLSGLPVDANLRCKSLPREGKKQQHVTRWQQFYLQLKNGPFRINGRKSIKTECIVVWLELQAPVILELNNFHLFNLTVEIVPKKDFVWQLFQKDVFLNDLIICSIFHSASPLPEIGGGGTHVNTKKKEKGGPLEGFRIQKPPYRIGRIGGRRNSIIRSPPTPNPPANVSAGYTHTHSLDLFLKIRQLLQRKGLEGYIQGTICIRLNRLSTLIH